VGRGQDLEKGALIVAILNLEIPLGEENRYRPISLLCGPHYRETHLVRVEPNIDSLLPQEQAGRRHGRSTVDHVALLTELTKQRKWLSLGTVFWCMRTYWVWQERLRWNSKLKCLEHICFREVGSIQWERR